MRLISSPSPAQLFRSCAVRHPGYPAQTKQGHRILSSPKKLSSALMEAVSPEVIDVLETPIEIKDRYFLALDLQKVGIWVSIL